MAIVNIRDEFFIVVIYSFHFCLIYIYIFYVVSRVSLRYFTTHTDLVQRQQEAIQQRKAIRKGLKSDKDWTGDGFVKESESMVSN